MKKKNDKLHTLRFRVTTKEKNKIEMLAHLYARGNMSEWLRYAAICAPRVLLKKPLPG